MSDQLPPPGAGPLGPGAPGDGTGATGRRESWGRRTNRFADQVTSRVDARTADSAHRAAQVITLAVRVLRWPTLVLLVLPIPFELVTLVLGLSLDGFSRIVVVGLALVGMAVTGTFAYRRRRILAAVEEPEALATELGIAVSMSDKVGETRGALEAIAGGGGWRVFSRMKGVWRGVGMTGRWIDQIGDLERARYFLPPTVGTTVTLTVVSAYLVPVSVVVCLFSVVGALAHAL